MQKEQKYGHEFFNNYPFKISEIYHFFNYSRKDSFLRLLKKRNPDYNVAFKKINVDTLDQFVAEKNIEHLDLIKIDVEGWEKFVLLGAEDILTNYSPIIMMEFTESNTFSAGYMVQDLYDILVAKGYIWHEIINGELHPSPKKLHYPYNNLIAIKP